VLFFEKNHQEPEGFTGFASDLQVALQDNLMTRCPVTSAGTNALAHRFFTNFFGAVTMRVLSGATVRFDGSAFNFLSMQTVGMPGLYPYPARVARTILA
jgi:hypothetical protein